MFSFFLSLQQEIHVLIRGNTHQVQQRQTLKFDRVIGAFAYNVGGSVWMFCCLEPQKC